MLLATDKSGRTIFQVAAEISILDGFQGILNLAE
jgi:hypothetical protein